MSEKITEAYLLKKTVYKEADYILNFYTKDFGKISCIAKSAKKSRKRFGGRLELFLELRIKIKSGIKNIKYLEDCNIIKPFSNMMNDLDKFKFGSFILEYVDILSEPEEANRDMFLLLKQSMEEINQKKNIYSLIPRFQYKALRSVGLNPELTSCYKCGQSIEDIGYLSMRQGGIACKECAKKLKVLADEYKFIRKFNEEDRESILKNILLFTKFTKYHTGKEFKSEKFLMES